MLLPSLPLLHSSSAHPLTLFFSTLSPSLPSSKTSIKYNIVSSSSHDTSSCTTETFTRDDVFGISQSGLATKDHSCYLQDFFHKVQLCNHGCEKQSEFLPFVIEGHLVGFIHNGFVEYLRGFSDVFIFPKDKYNGGPFGDCVSLHPMLKTAGERTSAVGYVVKCLGKELIPGIRNELTPVKSSFGGPIFFSLEGAAAPYFGIMLHGNNCQENVVKECKEEAGIPRSIAIEYFNPEYFGYLDLLRSLKMGDCS